MFCWKTKPTEDFKMKQIKKEWKKKDQIFKDQKKIAKQILFFFRTKIIVSLCAPPQWGKTGVSLYVAYKLCKRSIHPENVFFITGMSDRSWIEQMKDRVLPSWTKNVYHRNTLHKMKTKLDSLKEKRNILIIVDECHLANKIEHTLGKLFKDGNLKDPESLQQKNIKILQISATPSNSLIDAEKWNNYHQRLCPLINDSNYVSFQCLLRDDRVFDPFSFENEGDTEEYLELISIGKPKYHFIRLVSNGPSGSETYSKIINNLFNLSHQKEMNCIEMNMTKSKKEIDLIYESLQNEPTKHTLIIIKNMLGASKTLQDTYIGSVHESVPKKKDYSSEIQGLPGRMCGWNKQRGIYSPLIFCDRSIVEQYIQLYESQFDYQMDDLEWSDSRLKISPNGSLRSKDSYLSIGSFDEENENSSELKSEVSSYSEQR